MATKIASFWEDLVDLFFPRICPACKNPMVGNERHICTACLLQLPWIPADSLLGTEALSKFAAYQAVLSVHPFFEYHSKSMIQALLREIKYGGDSGLAFFLGSYCGQIWRACGRCPEFDLIIPVPLHPKKQRERGYNQSEHFALGLSIALGKPVKTGLLLRDVYTDSQTRKSKEDRIDAMKNIFSVKKRESLSGRAVLLVDDVLTTGATLEGCVEALVFAGCSQIHINTIAAAP